MGDHGARSLARRAFFEGLDGKLSFAGYAPPAPVAAPPPAPPALSFEDWAELNPRLIDASPQALAEALSTRGLTLEVWQRLECEYVRAIFEDGRAGRRERPVLYEAKRKEEAARRAATSSAGTPPAMPTAQAARAALSGTDLSPDFGAAAWEQVGRMPFVPPPPEVLVNGKRPAKTVPSKVVPSRVGGETMALDPAQQRSTPTLPFAGSDAAPGHVPHLNAWTYVTLCANLMLQPKQRTETLRRYDVPTEAALRAVEEHWRHPARRADLEKAMAELGAMLWGRVLG